ncbi:hypothetical protein WMY93_009842 [Mugilogobius chulae]|uniref:G-protein coupled receptors family 1 profile domain-containing protein n=1 Tax=Mugilogobius chulae TaxID=88201 RepID=A0AAW0PI05_9GOBI
MTTTPEYEDYGDETCDIYSTVKFGQIFNTVFFSIVVALSVFGNSLVIAVLVKYENLKSITNAFILNLTISDLLFTAGLPFWVYYYVQDKWTLGETACKTVNFIFYVGFYSSGFLLILMTIHCYIAVDLGHDGKRNGYSVRSRRSRMTLTSVTSGEEMSV